ncbi:hypothetical protein yc1106_03772 [Curvularia clavata]|uniref:Uncharacterized protein n=1 Tax=Curvularia clavata TaxID=95742 RepID=A0A9Q8Z916_CURCL|nr:hypothetical protein yc1106_03772 [Curvularia clavata]
MGANRDFKDQSGKSASDLAWRRILSTKDQDEVVLLRNLVGTEDSYDLFLGPLHRIVTGLSNADLQMQINMEPSRINDRDWQGMTPLMWAAARDNPVHLNMLLSRGAQIELKDSEGSNALHLAVKAESLECVKALLKAGANPNSVDGDGLFPLRKLWSLQRKSDVKRMVLVSYCANPRIQQSQGRTPLHAAVDLGLYEVALALTENGADINTLDSLGTPPIDIAIFRGYDKMVQLFCELGTVTSWNRLDDGGNNVLEQAAMFGTVKVMEVLSASDIVPIECYSATLMHLFKQKSGRLFDITCSFEKELAAFTRLLEKKAILLDLVEELGSSDELEDEAVSEESRAHDRYYEDGQYDEDAREEGGRDDGDDDEEEELDDVFEDALERLSLLDEPEMFASSFATAST